METSLRYGGDTKSLRFHAKEKFPLASNTFCQFNGELDTRIGAPTYLSAMFRHFFPDLSASLGVGVQYSRNKKLNFIARGKKEYPVTANGLLTFNIKARCEADEEFREITSSGAAEFCWNIFNIRKDQDLRLKFGCDAFDKVEHEALQRKLEVLQNEQKLSKLIIDPAAARDFERPYKLNMKSENQIEHNTTNSKLGSKPSASDRVQSSGNKPPSEDK